MVDFNVKIFYIRAGKDLTIKEIISLLQIIKGALALAGFVVFIALIFTFYRANVLYENIQGTWVNIECFTIIYTFTGNQYSRNGVEMGTFKIRGSHITFNCGSMYRIRVRPLHNSMILNGFQYLRK